MQWSHRRDARSRWLELASVSGIVVLVISVALLTDDAPQSSRGSAVLSQMTPGSSPTAITEATPYPTFGTTPSSEYAEYPPEKGDSNGAGRSGGSNRTGERPVEGNPASDGNGWSPNSCARADTPSWNCYWYSTRPILSGRVLYRELLARPCRIQHALVARFRGSCEESG